MRQRAEQLTSEAQHSSTYEQECSSLQQASSKAKQALLRSCFAPHRLPFSSLAQCVIITKASPKRMTESSSAATRACAATVAGRSLSAWASTMHRRRSSCCWYDRSIGRVEGARWAQEGACRQRVLVTPIDVAASLGSACTHDRGGAVAEQQPQLSFTPAALRPAVEHLPVAPTPRVGAEASRESCWHPPLHSLRPHRAVASSKRESQFAGGSLCIARQARGWRLPLVMALRRAGHLTRMAAVSQFSGALRHSENCVCMRIVSPRVRLSITAPAPLHSPCHESAISARQLQAISSQCAAAVRARHQRRHCQRTQSSCSTWHGDQQPILLDAGSCCSFTRSHGVSTVDARSCCSFLHPSTHRCCTVAVQRRWQHIRQ